MKRYIVAFISMSCGFLVGFAEFAVRNDKPLAIRAQGQRVPENDILIFQVTITTYAVAYAVGSAIYWATGSTPEREDLRKWSGGHMALLNALLGLFLVCGAWPKPGMPLAVAISFLIGLCLILSAVPGAWHAIRARLSS